jgi:phosphoglucosamine mutase
MSNLGLEEKLEELGIKLHRTPVGDRAVSAQMTAHGLSLGGEQSGHIILADHSTTGDGLLAAYQIMAGLIAKGARAQDAFDLFDPVPQKLENVEYDPAAGNPLDDPSVQETIEAVEADLGQNGRVLVRKSGTEPVIRVMVEAQDEDVLLDGVNRICQAITDTQSTDNQQTGT